MGTDGLVLIGSNVFALKKAQHQVCWACTCIVAIMWHMADAVDLCDLGVNCSSLQTQMSEISFPSQWLSFVQLCHWWWVSTLDSGQSCVTSGGDSSSNSPVITASSEGHTHTISEHKIDSHKYEMCSKSFKKCRYLDSHMQLHLGHEPFSCTMCNRCSSHSNHLTVHLCTNTGDKPYSRDICKRRLSIHAEDLLHIDVSILERNPSDVTCVMFSSLITWLFSSTSGDTGNNPLHMWCM